MAVSDADAGSAGKVEFSTLQRVKQSEELLAQLYVVEETPRRMGRGPVQVMLAVSVLSLVAFITTLLMRYNAFVTMYEDAQAKRSNFEVMIQRRDNLFGNLVKLTLNHAALEHSIFSHTSDKRTEAVEAGKGGPIGSAIEQLMKQGGIGKLLGDGGAGKALLGADGGFGNALGRLMAIVEQYPNVQSADTYKHMMTSLVDMEDRIASKREEYNAVAATYNVEITKWPWDYLAMITGFKRVEYFHEKPAGDTPIITPQIFQELLPLTHSQESKK
ncbi:Magnetosome protein MamQ [Candidatus Terasakiella magnetica]|nr:Magnetosome protein MamQ [Candidatus Terasakiella magnetica]